MKKYILHKESGLLSKVDYEKELNEQQLKVVLEGDGACLVLAGAGTGKTRTLVYRTAFLIEKGIPLKNIFLATFTNKAAREMVKRIEILLKADLENLWAGTFHHLANLILRKEAKKIGFNESFTILDREDSKEILSECIEELKLNKKEKMFPKTQVIQKIFNLSINSLESIENIVKENFDYLLDFVEEFRVLFKYFKRKKKNSNLMDFDDLLFYLYEILKDDSVRKKYASKFLYILVDEFQDTNKIQFEILKALSEIHKNILVVGDDCQSIYSFRGAYIKNILDFPKVFKNCKIFKLEINYRSTPQILNLANNIIIHNKNQFHKFLSATKKDGIKPIIVCCRDIWQQAKFVTQRIMELVETGIPLNEIAVLFRSRFQSAELELELLKKQIPYVVRGGLRFFEQAHIKDVLSYLKLILNPRDELSFKRALKLHEGIGTAFSQKIWKKFSELNYDFLKIFKEKIPLNKNAELGWQDFKRLISKLMNISSPYKMIKEILDSFYRDYCYLAFEDPKERILDLEQLMRIAENYESLKKFISDLSLFEEFKGEIVRGAFTEETLILTTIHQAKGLEWEVVFIIGCVDGQFPHPESFESETKLEEERRLFYVAVTRSKSQLYITYPTIRYDFRSGAILTKRSQFIEELKKDLFEEWEIEEV